MAEMQKIIIGLGKVSRLAGSKATSVWPATRQHPGYTTKGNEPTSPYSKLTDLVLARERKKILITGALGQLGNGLATALRKIYGAHMVIMTDIVKSKEAEKCDPFFYLDVMNQSDIAEIVVNHNIDTIIHFSALLSAAGEANVPLALKLNVGAVQNVLEVAKRYKTQVFIPSSIGAFGPTATLDHTPDLCVQRPRTIYGVTKVYAELLGEYYNERFGVDFRSLRFPGLEVVQLIFYDALSYGKHKCYLRPNTQLPMMYYADCINSIILYLSAPTEKLSHRTYNVAGYSFSPEEIAAAIRKLMSNFEIEYEVCPTKQKIADSWPRSLDDTSAKKDWSWKPTYDMKATVDVMFDLVKQQIEDGKNQS